MNWSVLCENGGCFWPGVREARHGTQAQAGRQAAAIEGRRLDGLRLPQRGLLRFQPFRSGEPERLRADGQTQGQPLLIEADAHRPYPQAILSLFGVTRFRRRRHGRGRRKHPDLKPPPGLLVGVVHKVRDGCGNLLRVQPRGRRGEPAMCRARRRVCRPHSGCGATSIQDYVRYPVPVDAWQCALWSEQRKQLLTTGLNGQKHRKTLPTS